ncbi:MAG TPA: hypothetical protein VLF39_02085 [Candidatus Saccharimonadales bacterium]|nr:hypothetical protein [Candidatus Saccharimonadales bacterium]
MIALSLEPVKVALSKPIAICGALLIIGAMLIVTPSIATQPTVIATGVNYKDRLKSQVDSSDGSPRSGRDPASQKQISLSEAASAPNSRSMANNYSTQPESAPSQAQLKAEGIGTNGCYVDYGVQGQECLPAHAGGANGVLTCNGVREHFASGIKVTGTDRYHLDSNHNGTACDSGD